MPSPSSSAKESYLSFFWRAVEGLLLMTVVLLPFFPRVSRLLSAAGFLIWVTLKLIEKKSLSADSRVVWLCYPIFFFLIGLSVRQVPPELFLAQEGLAWDLKWFFYLGLFFVSADLYREDARRNRFLLAFQASMIVVCLNGLYQMALGSDWFMHHAAEVPGRLVRMRSAFLWPNSLAMALLFAVPLAFADRAVEKNWSPKAIWKTLVFVLFSVCMILSFSRSAALALAAALAVVLVSKKSWRFLGLAAFLGFLFYLCFPVLRSNFWDSLRWQDITVGERLAFWKGACGMIAAHPWRGSGIGMSIRLQQTYAAVPRADYTHNAYLHIAAEMGLPALILFLIPAFWIFRRTLSRVRSLSVQTSAIAVACLAFFAQAFAESSFYYVQPAILFWLFWGCLAAALL